MKKLIAILLVIMLVTTLVACGSTVEEDIQRPASTTPSSDSTTSQGNNQQEDQPEQDKQSENTEEPEEQPAETAITINETILVDEAGVKITAKSLDEGSLFGPELKLLLENNSGKDLTFQCRNASVNGYMVESMMSVDVVDGKKANDSLTFMESDLDACGIDIIADMEFSFHIFDTNEWEDYLDTDAISIKTSAADTYEYTFDDSGDLAYEGNNIKIVVKGLSEDDSVFGPSIVVYIENNSGQDITVQTRDVSINGFMMDAMFSCDLAAGKRAIDTITFFESELEENEITAIEDIELSFHIFDYDSWDTIADTEVVKLTF